MKHAAVAASELAIISRTDALVIGGSFAGVSAALELARAGLSVTIVEPRTYLGREMTATHRYWLASRATEERHSLLADVVLASERAVTDHNAEKSTEYKPLHPDQVKITLENRIMEAGIKLLYATLPVRMEHNAGGWLAAIANKSGLQAIKAGFVIDSSETAITAALLGLTPPDIAMDVQTGLACYARVLEFTGVIGDLPSVLDIPSRMGIVDDRIAIRPGCRGEGHVLVEFALRLPADNSMDAAGRRESEARHRSLALAAYLINETPMFAESNWANASYELYGPFDPSETERELPAGNGVGDGLQPAEALWIVSPAWQPGHDLLDANRAAWTGERLATQIMSAATAAADDVQGREIAAAPQATGDMPLVRTRTAPRAGKPFTTAAVSGFAVPIRADVDVLVVGGGTSGATAAATAAREGVSTLLLELNPGLGGTGTLGGVDSYWFGRKVGFAERNTALVEQVHAQLRYSGGKWNIEAKMMALQQDAETSGVDVWCNVILFGALAGDGIVRGAAAATRWGPVVVRSRVLIDATGDGDAAAFAGAQFVYGSERDHTVMWYSLAQFEKPGRTRNNFTSMVDVSDVEDYTRAIVTGRRRGNAPYEHGIYVATRESRHIVGDVVMKLTDQMLHRRWPDVVNIHFSNHDVKGVSGADWVSAGCIPPNLLIEIPYRMLLPRGFDGILVVGKAISATHDALPAIRMQADLENLGGVAALAAAMAVKGGIAPRAIELERLQRELVHRGILPADTPTRRLEPIRYDDDGLRAIIAALTAEKPLFHLSNMRMNEVFTERLPFVEICSLGRRAIPFLAEAMHGEPHGPRKVLLAQALAMLESDEGVPVLLTEIERLLGDGGELPSRREDFMYVQLPPDHGAMPDVVYLLYSLGMARDARSVPVWARVTERLVPTEADFKQLLKCTYYYVDAVCSGAERLGRSEAVPIVRRLHGYAPLHDLVCREGVQPDYFMERRSMLELSIGRALARCGSADGYAILIGYLEDVRALLAAHAAAELASIAGVDFGQDASAWTAWLKTNERQLQPRPLAKRLDMETDSEELLRTIG